MLLKDPANTVGVWATSAPSIYTWHDRSRKVLGRERFTSQLGSSNRVLHTNGLVERYTNTRYSEDELLGACCYGGCAGLVHLGVEMITQRLGQGDQQSDVVQLIVLDPLDRVDVSNLQCPLLKKLGYEGTAAGMLFFF